MTRVSGQRCSGGRRSRLSGPRPLLGVLAAGVCLASLGAGGLDPARAASGHFRDPDDRVGLDIRKVHVRYGDNLVVRVEHDGRLRAGQVYRFWVDTDSSDPGPEYYYGFRPNSDGQRLRSVDDFGVSGDPVACDGDRGWADFLKPFSDVKASLPATCLGEPARVRVSVRFGDDDGTGDWAPRVRAFYSWVDRY